MLVVGITGPIGAGKDTVSEYLVQEYGFREISYGDVVRDIADEKDIEHTRENLQNLSREYREEHGLEYFAKRIAEMMEGMEGGKFVLSGIRRPEDFIPLEERYGEEFKLVVIDAEPRIRFERLKRRGLERDPDTYGEFEDQDEEEYKRFNMEDTFDEADYRIENNMGLEELKDRVDRFIENELSENT